MEGSWALVHCRSWTAHFRKIAPSVASELIIHPAFVWPLLEVAEAAWGAMVGRQPLLEVLILGKPVGVAVLQRMVGMPPNPMISAAVAGARHRLEMVLEIVGFYQQNVVAPQEMEMVQRATEAMPRAQEEGEEEDNNR